MLLLRCLLLGQLLLRARRVRRRRCGTVGRDGEHLAWGRGLLLGLLKAVKGACSTHCGDCAGRDVCRERSGRFKRASGCVAPRVIGGWLTPGWSSKDGTCRSGARGSEWATDQAAAGCRWKRRIANEEYLLN